MANDKNDIAQLEETISHTDELNKDHIDYNRIDKELAQYASASRIEISPEEDKRLKRMIDRRVLSIMVFTYFLQALDKGTMSFAAIILVVEYPTNWIIQRVPIAKYLSINIMLWGSILALHAACRNFPSILTVRTLLGIFEAVCQPSFLVLSGMWYKRSEQAATVTYWYMMNGGQQVSHRMIILKGLTIFRSLVDCWLTASH
jgi:hypothetical protein